MGQRKPRKAEGDVELNLAAMLDMAFQLLTFFILTFKPAPVEGQVTLRMPPAQPITPIRNVEEPGSETSITNLFKGLDTLAISVLPNAEGQLGSMQVDHQQVGGLARLNDHLREALGNQAAPFTQVLIQVGSGLRYDALMSVVDVCTRQKLPNGKPLKKLSFVELGGTK